MQFKEGRKSLAWAVLKKPGYKGEASGLYFHFYRTEAEADKARRWMVRNKQWTGPVVYMPGHCYELGAFVF